MIKKYKIEIELNTKEDIDTVKECFNNILKDMYIGQEIDAFYTLNVEVKKNE